MLIYRDEVWPVNPSVVAWQLCLRQAKLRLMFREGRV